MSDRKKLFLVFASVFCNVIPIVIVATKMSLFLSLPLFVFGVFLAIVALKITLPLIKKDEEQGRENHSAQFLAIMSGASFGSDVIAFIMIVLSFFIGTRYSYAKSNEQSIEDYGEITNVEWIKL